MNINPNPTGRSSELQGGELQRSRQTRALESKQQRVRQQSAQGTPPQARTSGFTTHKIRAAIDATPPVRAERVAELKARLQNGTYPIDSQRLAERMLAERE